jgi:hypothetical protein
MRPRSVAAFSKAQLHSSISALDFRQASLYTSNSAFSFNDSPASWNVPSTVDGLGTIGYISSSQLFSSIAGISFAN